MGNGLQCQVDELFLKKFLYGRSGKFSNIAFNVEIKNQERFLVNELVPVLILKRVQFYGKSGIFS